MSDAFEDKRLSPMLIGTSGTPFDSADYMFELKFDGVRCLAYVQPGAAQLRNKRNLNVTATYPELDSLGEAVNARCILDGELVAFENGKPAFSEVQRRALMADPFRIELAAAKQPICFVAFDILYYKDQETMRLPLVERKAMLTEAVHENNRLILSRVIEAQGVTLYDMAERESLEGVVAKRRDSLYFPGKRTKDWIKIKNLQDDDFVVLGYIPKDAGMNSLILGQYRGDELVYKGHVTLGVGGENFRRIRSTKKTKTAPVIAPTGNEDAVWLEPKLVCTVKFMERTASRSMRQPTFKGLREDKEPADCMETI